MRDLLLKQVLEGLAGVAVARRRRGAIAVAAGALLGVRSWRGVFFYGGAEFVERAVVADVLGRDALLDWLRALKLRAGIEEAALLATVQLEAAFGALAIGIEAVAEYGAAIGAARAGDRADHARGARAELIGLAGTARRRLAIFATLSLILFFRIAVSAMTILAIHKRLLLLCDCEVLRGVRLNCGATFSPNSGLDARPKPRHSYALTNAEHAKGVCATNATAP
jgi:hypothetical protein